MFCQTIYILDPDLQESGK